MKKALLILATTFISACATDHNDIDSNFPSSQKAMTPEAVGIDREGIRKVIQSNLTSINKCFSPKIIKNKDLTGTVKISWDINNKGEVTKAEPVDEGPFTKTAGPCLAKLIKTLKFPPAPTDTDVTVIFPFKRE